MHGTSPALYLPTSMFYIGSRLRPSANCLIPCHVSHYKQQIFYAYSQTTFMSQMYYFRHVQCTQCIRHHCHLIIFITGSLKSLFLSDLFRAHYQPRTPPTPKTQFIRFIPPIASYYFIYIPQIKFSKTRNNCYDRGKRRYQRIFRSLRSVTVLFFSLSAPHSSGL